MKGSRNIPVVALVGRPNVGKSTLFNRIVGRRSSLVRDEPGITRDRHYGRAEWAGWEFLLVDTGGFDPVDETGVMAAVRGQVLAAVSEADVIIFVADVREGLTTDDQEVYETLRRSSKPVLFAANKADSKTFEEASVEFYALGADQVLPVAAASGRAVGDLLDALVDRFEALGWERGARDEEPDTEDRVRVALVGRPNAGKSSLLNRLLGEDRAVVHDEPGTTRDPVDVPLDTDEGAFVLLDTAGIRRRKYIKEAIEHIAVLQAIRAMERADVVLLVCDAQVGIGDLEARLARQVWDAGKPLVLVLNKWDLVRGKERAQELDEQVEFRMRHVPGRPVVRTSALTGKGLARLLRAARKAYDQAGRRIPTPDLNEWLQDLVALQPPPTDQGRPVKIQYVTQPQVHPPTFVFFANLPRGIKESYRRFLTNRLREDFGFGGTPVRLLFRAKSSKAGKPGGRGA